MSTFEAEAGPKPKMSGVTCESGRSRTCWQCGKCAEKSSEKMYRCPRCNEGTFCGKECFARAWPRHRLSCRDEAKLGCVGVKIGDSPIVCMRSGQRWGRDRALPFAMTYGEDVDKCGVVRELGHGTYGLVNVVAGPGCTAITGTKDPVAMKMVLLPRVVFRDSTDVR
jgi:MYND finger